MSCRHFRWQECFRGFLKGMQSESVPDITKSRIALILQSRMTGVGISVEEFTGTYFKNQGTAGRIEKNIKKNLKQCRNG